MIKRRCSIFCKRLLVYVELLGACAYKPEILFVARAERGFMATFVIGTATLLFRKKQSITLGLPDHRFKVALYTFITQS